MESCVKSGQPVKTECPDGSGFGNLQRHTLPVTSAVIILLHAKNKSARGICNVDRGLYYMIMSDADKKQRVQQYTCSSNHVLGL